MVVGGQRIAIYNIIHFLGTYQYILLRPLRRHAAGQSHSNGKRHSFILLAGIMDFMWFGAERAKKNKRTTGWTGQEDTKQSTDWLTVVVVQPSSAWVEAAPEHHLGPATQSVLLGTKVRKTKVNNCRWINSVVVVCHGNYKRPPLRAIKKRFAAVGEIITSHTDCVAVARIEMSYAASKGQKQRRNDQWIGRYYALSFL